MKGKRLIWTGTGLLALFTFWTVLIRKVDVQAIGPAWLNSADQSTLSPGVITK